MFRSYYGLSFNPFDKQMCREKDRFFSRDISEMMNRLDYLKDTRGSVFLLPDRAWASHSVCTALQKALTPACTTWNISVFPP